jgi:hypothetical protein
VLGEVDTSLFVLDPWLLPLVLETSCSLVDACSIVVVAPLVSVEADVLPSVGEVAPRVAADSVVLEWLEPYSSGVVELGLSVPEEGLVLVTFSLEPVLVGSSVDEPELCEMGLELTPRVVEL